MDIIRRTQMMYVVVAALVALNLVLLYLVWRSGTFSVPPTESRDRQNQEVRIERLLTEKMNFDQTQLDAYRDLRRAHKQRMRALNERMRALKEELFDSVLRDVPQPQLSDSLLALTHATQDTIEQVTMQHLISLRDLCTPSQRTQFKDLLREVLRRKPRPTP